MIVSNLYYITIQQLNIKLIKEFVLKQPKCPSTDGQINMMWYKYTVEYYSDIKRNEIMPFSEMQVDLETVIQSEISQKEKKHILYNIIYIWNERYGTDELICKAEIETQMQRTNIWTLIGEMGGGMNGKIGIDVFSLLILRIKQVTSENLPYSSGNSTQCSNSNLNGKEIQKHRGSMYMYS